MASACYLEKDFIKSDKQAAKSEAITS